MGKREKKTILLVEDEALVAISEKLALEKYGYAVKTVMTGEMAVEEVGTDPEIDLILMDINLGEGIDGTRAAELILKNHDIPILFVSSHCEREIVEKTEKISSYGYVVKNSSITVLDASIKMAFKLFEECVKTREKTAIDHKNLQLLENIMDNFPGLIYWKDAGSIYQGCSKAFAETAGLASSKEILGKSDFDLPWGIHEAEASRRGDRAVMENGAYLMHLPETRHSGNDSTLYLDTSKIPLYDFSGNITGILGVSLDISERNKMLEALRVSKATAETLLNVAAELIIAHDSEGNITLLNESGHEILGYTFPELIGKNWFDTCLPEEIRLEVKDYFVQLQHGSADIVVSHENDVITRNGERKTISWHNVVLKDDDGNFIGLFSSGEDITKRRNAEILLQAQNEELKRTQELLRQSEIQFSLFMDSLPAIAFLKDANGRTLFTNKYMDSVLGSSDWLGKTMAEVFPNAFGEKLLADDLEILKSGYLKIEEDIPHRDGTIHSYETHKFLIHKSLKESLVGGVSLDITERRRSELALRESQERLDFALEGSGLGEWDWHLKTGKIKRNERWAQMLGYSLSEINDDLQQGVDLQHPDDRDQAWRAIQDHLGGKTDYYDISYRMKAKNGQYRWIHDCGKIMERDEAGKPVRLCGTHADISEQMEKEEKIKRLLAEKELILKEVHHRIKNNMNTMGSLLSLQSQTVHEPAAAAALEDAKARMQSMGILYDSLYRTAGFTELSVLEYLPDLVDEITGNFPNSSMVKVDKHIEEFVLDAKRLQPLGIIVNELLTNIMKYAFVGREHGDVDISATNTGGHIAIAVRDNGNGMPESVSFEKSTGFGLQLVYALTQQLNGTIRIERGNGTNIILEFER